MSRADLAHPDSIFGQLHHAQREPLFLPFRVRDADGEAARHALERAGIRVLAERDVVVQRLNQGVPGQLGSLTRQMAKAGVNIEVLYSDHDNQLILVVDDIERARSVSEAWARETRR